MYKTPRSKCSPLTRLGREQCETYMDESGYPCYWRLPQANDCWGRSDKQPRNARYPNARYPPPATSPSPLVALPPPLPPRPASYAPPSSGTPRGLYNCTQYDINSCGSNPNCTWAGKRKCIRRPYHLTGTQYEGPMGPPISPMGFGKKKRYNVPGSPCNKLPKRVCRSNPNCRSTKRGCRRRAGTVKGKVYEGPSLPQFGKHTARSVTSDIKKLMKM